MVNFAAIIQVQMKKYTYTKENDTRSGFGAGLLEVGKRNDSDIVVTSGLREGERIALEDPNEAAKRAKKL